MTTEENHLWYDFLKRLPLTVKRQQIIENYIVDFYIPSKKTVIEVDGIQHESPEHKLTDNERDKNLNEWGIVVLRYPNESINKNFLAVTQDILSKIELDFSDLKPI